MSTLDPAPPSPLQPAVQPPTPAKLPMKAGYIWAMCILLTPICGAVLYYAWKDEHPEAARYANRASWISWILCIVVYSVGRRMMMHH